MSKYDLLIRRGRLLDGTGGPSGVRDVAVRAGRVVAVSEAPLDAADAAEVVEAAGKWVMPGFVDIHTHYDAEVLLAPGLTESVRHGVTTVVMGSCSLSTIHSNPVDCADLFSRVEAVPRPYVLGALEGQKTWESADAYAKHLETKALGPNVAAFVGHSDLRTSVMGLARAVDEDARPTEEELDRMETLLEDGIAAGFLGLSTMTNPWDKLDGDRFRSKPLPSTFATWKEYQRFHRVLRRTGRILQSAPDLTTKLNIVRFLADSAGIGRKPLKTTLLTAADAKSTPHLVKIATFVTGLLNRFANADFKWQHLPVPFEVYADGIDLVVFEEFGAGRAALHLKDQVARNALMNDKAYRRRFRKDYETKFSPRVWHRDFYDAEIVACPDASVVGKSFGAVADARGIHPVDAYLDLVVEHGTELRWRTTIANHRPEVLNELAADPSVQMGFADSGAHLRNMAFYNFPVRLLERVVAAEKAGEPFLSLERAVHRLTGELAGWFGLDAGTLRVGDRADVVVLDPAKLDASVHAYNEAEVPEYGGMKRMVNRSGDAIAATVVNGYVAFANGAFMPGFGETQRTGCFLRVGQQVAAPARVAAPAMASLEATAA